MWNCIYLWKNIVKIVYYNRVRKRKVKGGDKIFNIEEQLKMLPNKPGVYIMHDIEDKIIYVEKAAYIRDRMLAIERVNEKQKVSNITENNIDVIGIAKSEIEVCVEIFFVRGSKMVGREHYFFQDLKEMEDKEIISGFIKQYYMDAQNIPNKIMVREELEDKNAIEEWLSNETGEKSRN